MQKFLDRTRLIVGNEGIEALSDPLMQGQLLKDIP